MEEPAIWRVAAYLVTKHGPDAAKVAQHHASIPAHDESRAVWLRVTKAALELLRETRGEGDSVN